MIPIPALMLALLLAPPPKPMEVVHLIRPKPLPAVPLWVALVPEQSAAGDALPLYLAAAQLMPRYNPERGKLLEAAYRVTGEKSPGQATPEELETIRKVVKPTADAIRLTERAAKVRICDWSGLVPPPPAGLNAAVGELLPTVQVWRELANAVKFRAYLSLAANDYPAAMADVRTIYGLAAHVGQAETLIQFLVGAAIKSYADGLVLQAMNAGCPNLLGPLAEFPRPLVPVGPAARRELGDLTGVLPPLSAIDRKALTPAAANAESAAMQARLLAVAGPGPDAAFVPMEEQQLQQFMQAVAAFAATPTTLKAQKRLADSGYDAKLLAAMPPAQVQLLDATVHIRRLADRRRLAFALPPGHPLLAEPKPVAKADGPAAVLFRLFLLMSASIDKCRAAEARQVLDTQALVLAEALRAALAEPGAEWGPNLLAAPLVKATLAAEPKLGVAWDAGRGAFAAPGEFRLYVWRRGE